MNANNTRVTPKYRLHLQFWKWNTADAPLCDTFNMEIAVTPISHAKAEMAACPNTGMFVISSPLYTEDGAVK